MTKKDGYQVEFTQPTRQILFMLIVLALVAVGATVLGRQIESVFYANIFLNGVIAGVFLFGVMATFVSHEDVPEDVVYEVTRAVFENLDDFRSLHPAFANLDPKEMITNALSAPIHPGAQRYYDEMGW